MIPVMLGMILRKNLLAVIYLILTKSSDMDDIIMTIVSGRKTERLDNLT